MQKIFALNNFLNKLCAQTHSLFKARLQTRIVSADILFFDYTNSMLASDLAVAKPKYTSRITFASIRTATALSSTFLLMHTHF